MDNRLTLLVLLAVSAMYAQVPGPPPNGTAAKAASNDPAPDGSNSAKEIATNYANVAVVVGIVSQIAGEHTDYKVNTTTNVLEGKNLGRATPQLLAGLSFGIPKFGHGSVCAPVKTKGEAPSSCSEFTRWNAYVNVKFNSQSSSSIDGFVFGFSYRVQPYLDLLAGYSLSPYNEPSPGFRKAASLAVSDNPALYKAFSANDLTVNNLSAFDGFPLAKQGTTAGISPTNLYAGEPLATHYRGGFVIGVAIPFDLVSLFKKL